MSTFLLTVTAIAVWILFYQSRLEEPELRQSLKNLKLAARDLFVTDENQFAAVKKHVYGNDHYWRVYLPDTPDAQYRLRVANDDIPDRSRKEEVDLPESILFEVELEPGRHEIGVTIPYDRKLRSRGAVMDVRLLLDGVEIKNVSVPGFITLFFGSPISDVTHSVQQSTTEPLVLTRSFDRRSTGKRRRGFMMWIESVNPKRH